MPKSKTNLKKKKELLADENIDSDPGTFRNSRRTRTKSSIDHEDSKTLNNRADNHSSDQFPGSRDPPDHDESMTTAPPSVMAVMRTRRKCQPPLRFRDSSEQSSDVDSPKKTFPSRQKPLEKFQKLKKQVARLDAGQTFSEGNSIGDLDDQTNVDDKFEVGSMVPLECHSDTAAATKTDPRLKNTLTVLEAGSTVPLESHAEGAAMLKKDPRLKNTLTVLEAGSTVPLDSHVEGAAMSKKYPRLKKSRTVSKKTCYCSYCGKTCRNLAHVTQHERTHSGEKPFPCQDCGKCFTLKGNMLQHRLLHSEGKPFVCEICGQFFKTRAYCKQHQDTHQTSKIHKCEFVGCMKSFNCRKNYLYHKMTHAHRKYECRKCGKAFHRKSQLIIHETSHSKVRRFECPKCGKKCHSINAYNSHMRIHKKKPHSCAKCKKSFETFELRDQHEELHKWYPFYDCEVCNRCGMSFPEMSRHLKLHRSETFQSINCSDCGRTFASQNTYDQHYASFEIYCALCDESQATICKWYVHRRTHKTDTATHSVNNISHVCDVCGKSFSTASIYKSHLLTHGDYTHSCDVCGKKSKSKAVHLVHMQIHSGEKTCFCEACGKSFACRYNLKQHSLIHSGLKAHKCDICSKAFRTKSLLKEHNLVHRKGDPYKCELCGKEYVSKANFKNHQNVHLNRRNYECKVCGKRFFSGYVLRKHVQIHTGQKNYQCEYCGKGFIQQGNWLIHRRSHTGDKPNRCSRCPLGFVTSSQLKQHMKRVHDKNKTAMCDKCFKHFYDQKSLLKHIQNMHVKKEGTRVHACSKCGAFFTEAANQDIHEMNCTAVCPSMTHPSVLQNTLKLIYHSQSNENGQNCKSQMMTKSSTSEKYESVAQLESMEREKHNCENLITLFKAITESESKPPLDLEELQIVSLPETRQSNTGDDDEDVLEQFCVPDAQIKVEVVMEEDIAYMAKTDVDDRWATETSGSISGGIQCSLCMKMFLTDQELQKHQQLHEEEHLFQCGRCQSRFRTADSLIKHLQECLVQADQLSDTGTSVARERSLIHRCDICQKQFHLLGHLKLHKDSHRVWAQLKCNICRRKFKNRMEFDDHYRSHSGKKRFQCSMCSKEFTLRKVLDAHKRSCHQETRYTCPRCSQCFTKIEDLKDHATAHFRDSLVMSAAHRSPVPRLVHKSVQASIDVYKKGIVAYSATSKIGSKTIAERVHAPIKDSESNKSEGDLSSTAAKPALTSTEAVRTSYSILYTCGICDARFSTQSHRDRHQTSHRVDVLVYVCSICEQKFSSQHDLEVHMVIHGPNVQFLCQICDLRFQDEVLFMAHVGVHGEVVMMVESDPGQAEDEGGASQ